MSIQDFFTKLFVVKRPTWFKDEEQNDYSELAESGQFNGHIQQAGENLVASLGLTFTTAYTIWCPIDTDVRIGDTIDSIDGRYSVKGIQKNDNGINRHLQLVVQYDGVVEGS